MADFNIDDDDSNSGEWLNTYADLVTLLLCLFVLLYSMSIVDIAKFKKAAGSLNSIGSPSDTSGVDSSVGNSIAGLDVYNAINVQQEMEGIYKEIKELVAEKGLSEDVQVEEISEGVLLRFKDEILFDSGEALLKDEAKNTLKKLADILRKHNKQILVEGHTDNVPIKNKKFKDNWELSAARAINVVRYFTEELPEGKRFDPKVFEVIGYGEYKPIAPNDTAENRQKNRRIEVTIRK